MQTISTIGHLTNNGRYYLNKLKYYSKFECILIQLKIVNIRNVWIVGLKLQAIVVNVIQCFINISSEASLIRIAEVLGVRNAQIGAVNYLLLRKKIQIVSDVSWYCKGAFNSSRLVNKIYSKFQLNDDSK